MPFRAVWHHRHKGDALHAVPRRPHHRCAQEFGTRCLHRRMAWHVFLLFVLQCYLVVPTPESDAGVAEGHALRWACETVIFSNAAWKFRVEMRELMYHGVQGYFGVPGAFLIENCCSLLHCGAVLYIVAIRVFQTQVLSQRIALFLFVSPRARIPWKERGQTTA